MAKQHRRRSPSRLLVVASLVLLGTADGMGRRPLDDGPKQPEPKPTRRSGRPPCLHLPLTETIRDLGASFRFDSAQAISPGVWSGQRMGWCWNTIAVDETGSATLCRDAERTPCGSIGTWTIPPEGLASLATCVRDTGLPSMARVYRANVADGTQWVFWLKQGTQEKSIYCDNHFPEAIQDFAVFLDDLLSKCGYETLIWTRLRRDRGGEHNRHLWNASV